MTENTAPARCTEGEYEHARTAGLLVVTTSDEVAIHSFAEAIRTDASRLLAQKDAELQRLLERVEFHRAMTADAQQLAAVAQAEAADLRSIVEIVPEMLDEAKERTRFEAWMVDEGHGPLPRICSAGSPCEGEYADQYWHRSWAAWMAAKRDDSSRLNLLTALAQHRGFESLAKAMRSLAPL